MTSEERRARLEAVRDEVYKSELAVWEAAKGTDWINSRPDDEYEDDEPSVVSSAVAGSFDPDGWLAARKQFLEEEQAADKKDPLCLYHIVLRELTGNEPSEKYIRDRRHWTLSADKSRLVPIMPKDYVETIREKGWSRTVSEVSTQYHSNYADFFKEHVTIENIIEEKFKRLVTLKPTPTTVDIPGTELRIGRSYFLSFLLVLLRLIRILPISFFTKNKVFGRSVGLIHTDPNREDPALEIAAFSPIQVCAIAVGYAAIMYKLGEFIPYFCNGRGWSLQSVFNGTLLIGFFLSLLAAVLFFVGWFIIALKVIPVVLDGLSYVIAAIYNVLTIPLKLITKAVYHIYATRPATHNKDTMSCNLFTMINAIAFIPAVAASLLSLFCGVFTAYIVIRTDIQYMQSPSSFFYCLWYTFYGIAGLIWYVCILIPSVGDGIRMAATAIETFDANDPFCIL